MGHRGIRGFVALTVVAALIGPGAVRGASPTAASRLASETLGPINPLAPQDFGAAGVNGLAYANPNEGLSIISAPVPNSDGSVQLAYQLQVPPGHGITPNLTVQYASGGGNGWLGQGWDLSVGEVTIDTTFGAPRFDQAVESESYLLDGGLLVPNANDDAGAAELRVAGDKSDYSRQVDKQYEEIIRHQIGNTWPADYFWEVKSKDGSVRWYGGTPDSGGPAPTSLGTIDENAVVRNETGHIVKWLLAAQRDIGVNLIRYEYDTVEYEFDGNNWGVADCDPADELCAQHTYLDRILYTDATSAIADRNGPPYEVNFVRESEMAGSSGEQVRSDPVVDARLGYVDVIPDRLARVEVNHGPLPDRIYNNFSARYDFTYTTGRFGKSMLSEMKQGRDDLHVHKIEYYDDLTDTGANTVDGFANGVDLDTAPGSDGDGDVSDITFLDTTADVSALGGSETNSGSGNIYVGFNPITPSKTLSSGVALEFSGGDTDAIAEWIDLNGDNLPDKVFLDGDTVRFRLNTTGASGSGSAGDWPLETAGGIHGLSANSNFGFQISGQTYPLIAFGLGTGFGLSWSNTYFTDVNGDGFVDFVAGGTVYFNSLDDDGIPTFSTSSANTPIPLDPSALPTLSSDQLDELVDKLRIQSPPIDTVRRFVAPFTGAVSIAAPVTLDTVGATIADGVRVAIQHNGTELSSAVLDPAGTTSAFGTPMVLPVTAGDRMYFRVGSIDDGTNDAVDWQPMITYQAPTWPELDANGLSQWAYSASSDFTLAGRPQDFIAMPFNGTARVQGAVVTTEPLTDALTVVAVKRDPDNHDTPVVVASIPANAAPGTFPFTQDIAVALREVPDASDPSQVNVLTDKLSVYVAADSPVDLSAIDFSGTITYASITGGTGHEEFEHHIRPHVELYPYANLTTGARQSTITGTHNVSLAVRTPQVPSGVTSVGAVITVKTASGLVTKVGTTLNILGDVAFTPTPISVNFGAEATKWVDVMIRDGAFSANGLTLLKFVTVAGDPAVETPVPNAVLRWSGLQGIFPQPYRGWAVAGYTAGDGLGDGAMSESAFVIDPNSFPSDDDPPTRDDASLEEPHTQPSYAFIPAVQGSTTTGEPVATDRWVGPRDSLYGDATILRTSRLLRDSVDFSSVTAPAVGGGRSAPTRLGISGPDLNIMFGIGLLGASAGLSPSFGLHDFEDLNGDGYPDVVGTGSVTYTNQVGSYIDTRPVSRASVTNQDLTISVNGGLSAGIVDVQPSPKGGTNVVAGDSASKSQSASDAGPSFSLGVSASGGYSWTSPNASGGAADPSEGTYGDQIDSLRSDFGTSPGAEIQRAFADVNGDGLADSVYTTAEGTFAFYNLGYGFTSHAAKLGVGGFESRESASGGAGLGFALPYGEFAGGVNLLFNYDWSTYSWRDVNGDRILDQLRRESASSVKVRFGTGSGLLPAVDYGNLLTVPVSPGIDGGEQVAFDRSSGIGGGAQVTGYIGPLCLVACYLVIGAGAGFNQSRSSSSVDFQDLNGDGFADSLQSLNDDQLTVATNQQDRSNFLRTVTNPLGGSFTVDYERTGNTSDHPDSIWVMKRVDIDDGRSDSGDYASTFEYEGLEYDRTHRVSLGFDKLTITELDTADGDAPLRFKEQEFLNDDVFVKGLLTKATMFEPKADAPNGRAEQLGSTVTWGFNVVRGAQAVPGDADPQAPIDPLRADQLGDTHSVASRGWSIAPLIVANDQYWYNSPGDTIFERRTEFDYDGLGNVLVEHDLGAPDDAFDNLTTTITYSKCTAAGDTLNPCRPEATPQQPFWSPGTCTNWASYPTRVVVEGVDGTTGTAVKLRERISPKLMCDNGAATQLLQLVSIDGGTPIYSTTDMVLNQYGDYALVLAPPGDDGVRYLVKYTYDADRNSDVAKVEEFDVVSANAPDVLASGPTAANSTAGISSTATFDPTSGRANSRTDANGAIRRYSFDELGRIAETFTMETPDSPAESLITYEYNANDPAYAYAIARHVDAFDGNKPAGTDDAHGQDTSATIDTITFVDGLGRVRQTKRDARLSVDGEPAVNTRQVSDGVEFDALARPVVQYAPTADTGPATQFSTSAVNGVQTVTSWYSYDLLQTVTQPGDRTTSYNYPWESIDESPLLAWTEVTDPEGRVTIVAQDVRDVTRYFIDKPAPREDANGNPVTPPPDQKTQYVVNSLGELTKLVDSGGAESAYEYDLAGRVTRATTPNGGTVRTTYDLAGRRATSVNEAMAAVGKQTTFGYELNRLTSVDYPGSVDDVSYEYGLDNTDGRFTAGRIRHLEDRTRLVDNTFSKNGALVEQTAVIKRHNWSPALTGTELDQFTYTTKWTYDDLGRIATIAYPDSETVSYVPDGTSVGALTSPSQLSSLLQTANLGGEVVSYDYDSGGLLRNLSGAEQGIKLVTENITPDELGQPRTIQVPRLTTHPYPYLNDRLYNARFMAIRDDMGNGTISEYTFDPETRWLEAKKTTGPGATASTRSEIQHLGYTYDAVGRPLTYDNDLPFANRAINGGDVNQQYSYDGFGRLRGAKGSFALKAGEEQRYTYGVDFTPTAPWSVVDKTQTDALVTISKNKTTTKVNPELTYSFDRELGNGGPLRVVSDDLTVSGQATQDYDYEYNANGGVDSMLNNPGTPPSETNVWDRAFTWTLMGQLTSADDGSELRTFAYDDSGRLTIQDGNLLTLDGAVVAQHGGGPETIFLNKWVTVVSQKIYKHVVDGRDKIATKMDAGAAFETKSLYLHSDLVGSTNIVTDNLGRGFQRHEYFPSGEIWIKDNKEEIRTPFQFGDGYYEEHFELVLFGARWYDTERELFLSPDPLLSADPRATITRPGLTGAYTYAGAAAVTNVDPSGLEFFGAASRVEIKAQAQEAFDFMQAIRFANDDGDEAHRLEAKRVEKLEAHARAQAVLEPNAIIKIDLGEQEVSFGAPYGPRLKWSWAGGNTGSQASPPDGQPAADSRTSTDATSQTGGPNAGDSATAPGSTHISVSASSSSSSASSSSSGDVSGDQADIASSGEDDSSASVIAPVVHPQPTQDAARHSTGSLSVSRSDD